MSQIGREKETIVVRPEPLEAPEPVRKDRAETAPQPRPEPSPVPVPAPERKP